MKVDKIRPVIQLSGPFSKFNETNSVEDNVHISQRYAHELRQRGLAVICPHLNGGKPQDDVTWEVLMEECYSTMLSCHGVFMLPNWRFSKGAQIEEVWAREEFNVPIFYTNYYNDESLDEPIKVSLDTVDYDKEFKYLTDHYQRPKSIWQRCPLQVHTFLQTVNEMFRLHLQKNEDYSPQNILGTGEVGLSTRVWDKVARLMNLSGFDITTGQYSEPKTPNNESVNDNLTDMSNYGIIWKIYRMGRWGV